MLSAEARDDVVLPELRLGLSDIDDTLVQASLQALADLAGSNHGNIMDGTRSKLFSSRKAPGPARGTVPHVRVAPATKAVVQDDADESPFQDDAADSPSWGGDWEATGAVVKPSNQGARAASAARSEVGTTAVPSDVAADWGNDGWGDKDDGWGDHYDGAGPADAGAESKCQEGASGEGRKDNNDDASDYGDGPADETSAEIAARLAEEVGREKKKLEAKVKRLEDRDRRHREREERKKEREAEKETEKKPRKKGGLKIGKAKLPKKRSDGDGTNSVSGAQSPATLSTTATPKGSPPKEALVVHIKAATSTTKSSPPDDGAEEEPDYFASVGLDSVVESVLAGSQESTPDTPVQSTGASRLGVGALDIDTTEIDGEWDMDDDAWQSDNDGRSENEVR